MADAFNNEQPDATEDYGIKTKVCATDDLIQFNCILCGSHDDHGGVVVSLFNGEVNLGHLCETCIKSGPAVAAKRARLYAERLRRAADWMGDFLPWFPKIREWATIEELAEAQREFNRAMLAELEDSMPAEQWRELEEKYRKQNQSEGERSMSQEQTNTPGTQEIRTEAYIHHFEQDRPCAICGVWHQQNRAAISVFRGTQKLGDVCQTCAAAGPTGAAKRLLDNVEQIRKEADEIATLAPEVEAARQWATANELAALEKEAGLAFLASCLSADMRGSLREAVNQLGPDEWPRFTELLTEEITETIAKDEKRAKETEGQDPF